ncbi:MAG: alkaline phytoceramidase, partial [Gammaproteobacteria bacterium]|nr:alkaline phytoceramidase [Gammaproteobacteria bacterium]
DLRPYLLVQFGPMLVLPVIIWRCSGPGTRWLWFTVVFYLAAKLLELADHQALALTDGLVSGHTLKHLAAAAGACMIVAKIKMATNIALSDQQT